VSDKFSPTVRTALAQCGLFVPSSDTEALNLGSIETVLLIQALEDTLGIMFVPEDFSPEGFSSIQSVCHLLARKARP